MSCWRFRAAAVDSASFWILIYSLLLHVFLHLLHALGKTLQTLALCHWLPLQLLPWKGERHKSYLSEICCIDLRLILLFWSAFENCPGTGKHNKAMLKCCLFAQLNPLCTITLIFCLIIRWVLCGEQAGAQHSPSLEWVLLCSFSCPEVSVGGISHLQHGGLNRLWVLHLEHCILSVT